MDKKNKRKLPVWGRIIIISALGLTVVFTGIYGLFSIRLGNINEFENAEIIPPEKEYFEADIPTGSAIAPENVPAADSGQDLPDSVPAAVSPVSTGDIVWPSDGDILKNKNTINILLIGQDRRPGETRARSDSMMIGTINKEANTIKLTSLMRDLYVQIPGYSDNRINAAYAFGGMKLLDATIQKNFQVQIDGNIEVDFDTFQEIINHIGGIDLTINGEEAEYLGTKGFPGLTAGEVHMDGALALEYSRIRYIGRADYERTERQKRILTTVYNNVRELGLARILSLVKEMLPMVKTDLSSGQIISCATYVVRMEVGDIDTYRIPADGAFSPAWIRQMAVLVPDLTANRKILKEIIDGEQNGRDKFVEK